MQLHRLIHTGKRTKLFRLVILQVKQSMRKRKIFRTFASSFRFQLPLPASASAFTSRFCSKDHRLHSYNRMTVKQNKCQVPPPKFQISNNSERLHVIANIRLFLTFVGLMSYIFGQIINFPIFFMFCSKDHWLHSYNRMTVK